VSQLPSRRPFPRSDHVLPGARRHGRSLAAGQFYSSTGVELDEISFDGATLRLRIRPQPEVTYTTHFIGMEGKVLASVEGSSPQYTLTGAPEETYVRARVEASNGAQAWTQPIWPARGD